MATNFSPCKGSYVLNQFPSNVMFGMNGFHVSASGAIQAHHGPLVFTCLQCTSFGQISPFSTVFSKLLENFLHFHQILNRHLQILSVWKRLKLVVWETVNPCLQIYSFQRIEEKGCRKTLWKKVKLLEMSNFTFSHNVLYSIFILNSFDSHISVVICSFFEFGTFSKWCIWEWVLTLS